MQDSLAEEISQNLGRQISPGEHQALAAAKIQTDPEAYQLYLKGRYFADLWTPDNVRKAMAFFDQALARDPKFALAHVGKAYAYWGLSSQFIPSSEAMPKVKSEAEAALLLDPKLAEAHAALAIALADYDRDYVRAEGEFKKAIELNPGSEVAPLWYGYLLLARERPEEALVQLRKALDLDPLSALVESQIGLTYYWGKRDLEKSLSHFERAVQLQPDFYWPHIFKAFLLDRMGKPELAHTSAMKAKEVGGSAIVTGYLGYEAAKLGHREEALRCLHELESQSVSGQGYVGPYAFALIHMGLGDEARTLDWLTKLVDGRDEAALFFAVDPMWDPLRKHKEFQALARKVSQP